MIPLFIIGKSLERDGIPILELIIYENDDKCRRHKIVNYLTIAGKEGFEVQNEDLSAFNETSFLVGLENCIVTGEEKNSNFSNRIISKVLLSGMAHTVICEFSNNNNVVPPYCEYNAADREEDLKSEDKSEYTKFIDKVYNYIINQ